MDLDIKNKTAVITGADSGIGLETAIILQIWRREDSEPERFNKGFLTFAILLYIRT